MNEIMIRRYVREILLEKIRSKKNVRTPDGKKSPLGSKFNFKKFKAMPNAAMMLAYAELYLTPLGMGSSREAFIFTDNSVLKIALNHAGIAQNEAEINIHTTPSSISIPAAQVTTKIYDMDDEYRWLTAEIVKPMPELDSSAFEEFTGLSWREFVKIARGPEVSINDNIGISQGAQKMIVTVQSLMNNLGLKPGDLFKIEHWGNAGGGQMLLLDYGFTVDVRDKHYLPSGAVAPGIKNSTPLPGIKMPSNKPQPSPDENAVSTVILKNKSTTGR